MEILHVKSLTFLCLFAVPCSSDVLKSNGTAALDLNAEMIVALGRKLKKPLLTVIGKVMENYHLCTDWSEWTNCGAMTVNYFSTRSRTRHCALMRSQNGKNIPEKEESVCEGICPPEYNLTGNGLCLKVYSTPSSRDDAEDTCKSDGGILININNDVKYADVRTLLTAKDEKRNLHIDGRRTNTTSPWLYFDGSVNDYIHWYPGYPKTGETRLCLQLTGHRAVVNQQFLWFNGAGACIAKLPFICEART